MSDGFTIRHNVTAMFAQRQSVLNNGSLSQSLERLSSGYRINRASDDAAGMAVSETLRSQIRGTQQARKNAQDALGLIRVTESGIQEITDMVQRMRELTIQSANGVYTDADRNLLQLEIDQLKAAIDEVASGANYNGIVPLAPESNVGESRLEDFHANPTWTYTDNGISTTMDIPGVGIPGQDDFTFDELNDYFNRLALRVQHAARAVWGRTGLGNEGRNPGRPLQINFYETTEIAPGGASASANQIELNISLERFYEDLKGYGLKRGAFSFIEVIQHEISHTLQGRNGMNGPLRELWLIEGGADWGGNTAMHLFGDIITTNFFVNGINGLYNDSGIATFDYKEGQLAHRYIAETYGTKVLADFLRKFDDVDLESPTESEINQALLEVLQPLDPTLKRVTTYLPSAPPTFDPTIVDYSDMESFEGKFMKWVRDTTPRGDIIATEEGEIVNEPLLNMKIKFQLGANKNQSVETEFYNLTTGALDFLAYVDITSRKDAERSIAIIDRSFGLIQRVRSQLGAIYNRIEHSLNYMSTYQEALQSSESRIRDSDMAGEMINFTKNQVIVQAANAMLSQANLIPQNVLSLLG